MDVVGDAETYPNFFSLVLMPLAKEDDRTCTYEISQRRNDAHHIVDHIKRRRMYSRMFGFNNMAFDYPLLHYLFGLVEYHRITDAAALTAALFDRAQHLISRSHQPWENFIRWREMAVPQVDLLMVNHFDNVAKMTSLKTLEFNMASPSLEELPFPVGTTLTPDQMDVVLAYNINDVRETKRFAWKCMDAIRFREKLIADGVFGAECVNWNDTKIGERYFIKRLEEVKPGCTRPDAEGRKPGTHRAKIALGDVIVPYVAFEQPELRDMLARLKDTTIDGTETKNAYKIKVNLGNLSVHIGQGGIHGSIEKESVFASQDSCIIDIDVTGYYPSVAIVNRIYPQHIGPVFCDVYREIRDDRARAKKAGEVVKAGTLKLATNGAFGKTGSRHSALFDAACMMGITLNGQLLQCLLGEALLRVPGLRLLQMNTDGLTVTLPRAMRPRLEAVCDWWQRQTCLELEFADYAAMHIRDVNNYLGLYSDDPMNGKSAGKVKRKGAYDHEMLSGSTGGQKAWNRDFSALVVPMAAEAAFLQDQDPADFIANHEHAYDFAIRAKVTGASRLVRGGEVLGKTVRYIISTDGLPLVKVMPPLPGKDVERRIGFHAEGQADGEQLDGTGRRKGWRCLACGSEFALKAHFDEHNKTVHAWPVTVKNKWDGDISNLDRRWYVQEAEKLLF